MARRQRRGKNVRKYRMMLIFYLCLDTYDLRKLTCILIWKKYESYFDYFFFNYIKSWAWIDSKSQPGNSSCCKVSVIFY